MSLCQIHISLFACGETTENLIQLLILHHLLQDDKGTWVQHLVNSGPIILVLDPYTVFINLVLRCF